MLLQDGHLESDLGKVLLPKDFSDVALILEATPLVTEIESASSSSHSPENIQNEAMEPGKLFSAVPPNAELIFFFRGGLVPSRCHRFMSYYLLREFIQ